MHNEMIHKLIVPTPTPQEGLQLYLNDIILCWNEQGAPSPEEVHNTAVSKNINEVTCMRCWDVWVNLPYSHDQ